MRSTLLALLASASIAAAAGCVQNTIDELVAETACGSVGAITKCIEAADLQRLDEIERCYSSNGCTTAEAIVESVWFAKDCRPLQVENGKGDLKRRADSTNSATTTTEQTTTSKPNAKSTTKTASSKTTSAPSSASASTTSNLSTTSDSSTSTTDSASTTATTASSTTSTASTDSSSSATSTGSTSTNTGDATGAACSVTSMVSTTVCSVSGKSTITCTPTMAPVSSCAPGNICFTTTAGPDVCMKRDDHLTLSGLIVTIVFSLGIGATAIAFAIMSFRGSARAKQEERNRLLAEANSKKSDVEAQSFPNRSEANLPLITPDGTRSDQNQYLNQPGQDYFGNAALAGRSLTPSRGPPAQRGNAPQLHQGLAALGQDTRL